MSSLLAPDASLERLYTGTEWAEGPVWLPGDRALRWSDIPNNRIMQYHADDGRTVVYREDVEFTNGRTLDLDGAVVQCSHGRHASRRGTLNITFECYLLGQSFIRRTVESRTVIACLPSPSLTRRRWAAHRNYPEEGDRRRPRDPGGPDGNRRVERRLH
jgi:hypothetical protein